MLDLLPMLANAKVLAGSGWLGLKDREAYVTRGVKLTPMFTGFTARYAGFVNSETPLALGGTLSFSGAGTTATEAVAA